MDLPVQVAHGLQEGHHRLVAEAAEEGSSDDIEGADKAVDDLFPLRGAGKEAFDHQLLGVGVDLPQAHQHPLGMAEVRPHPPGGEKGGLNMGLVLKCGGVFFVDIAVKDAAEEPFKGPVIAVDYFHNAKSFLSVPL